MGYRISLYRCPKKDIDAIRNITDNDIEDDKFSSVYDILTQDKIKYDTLAHVLDTGKEEEYNLCSRLFTNKLSIECDLSFYTISNEQLLNIIEYIRKNNIYDYYMATTLDYDKIDCDDKETNEKKRTICTDARFDAKMWDSHYTDDGKQVYFNIDVSDNKWWVTNASTYRYAIFNFIHILKIFDWENDYLIALGG